MSEEASNQGIGGDGPSAPVSDSGSSQAPVEATSAEQEDSSQSFKNWGHIQGEQVTITNEIHYHRLSDEGRIQKLSITQHFERLDGERLSRERGRIYCEMTMVEPIVQRLEETPLLILTGQQGFGKTSLAIAASHRLWDRQRGTLEAVLLCRHLENNIRVDLKEVAGESEEFHRRIVIFREALNSGNEDFLRFVASLSSDRLEAFLDRLRRSGSFLIVTADQPGIPVSSDKLKGLGVLHELEEPTADLLLGSLRHLSRQLSLHQGETLNESVTERIEALIQSEGTVVSGELRGFSMVSAFAREYLVQVLHGKLSLREALLRVKDLSPWLLEELPERPEIWCTVLALILCSASRRHQGVPWFQFEALRRELVKLVDRETGRRRPRRNLREISRGGLFLKQAQAEIVPQPFPEADVVRFSDPRRSDQLWEILLGPGRDLAAMMIPLLRRLLRQTDSYLAQAAASSLGRLGQIDPSYVTYSLIAEWTDADGGDPDETLARGILLGSLYQGILGSREDEEYRRGCLQLLPTFLRSDTVKAVQAVLVALLPIATYDRQLFGFAMNALKETAEKWLKPDWKELRAFADQLREKEQTLRLFEKIFETRGTVEEIPKRATYMFRRLVVARKAGPVFQSFQYTLTGLFFSAREQRAVLESLLEWIREDHENLGPLITYIFLQPDGIGTWLSRTALGQGIGKSETAEGSPFLESMYTEAEAAAVLGSFLEQVHQHLRSFPGLLGTLLEQGFLSLLGAWAREGRSIPRLRPTVVDLLSGFFESSDPELNELILSLAQSPPASPELTDLHHLAIEAVTRPPRCRSRMAM